MSNMKSNSEIFEYTAIIREPGYVGRFSDWATGLTTEKPGFDFRPGQDISVIHNGSGGASNLLSSGYRDPFPRVKRQEREVDH
jgi:hypothetical protein